MKGSVVVTGGGTGGHLKVAKEFIEEFHKRGMNPYFIGSKNGQDKEWFERDYHLKKAFFLDTKGVVNKDFKGKLLSLWNIYKEMRRCMEIFEKADVQTVVSVGGFSAAPASFAAILTSGCKLYIHEQNSLMGKLNQLTSRFATAVFSSYTEKSVVKDYPVNAEFFENGRIRNEVKSIIFLGGSQGAKAINDFALGVAHDLNLRGIKIIHQTGKIDFERVQSEYEKLGIQVDVFDFTQDISAKMYQADFAVSRAGASTLWELAANSLPTLFVPFPYAAGDHQYYNAKFLADKKMCFLCRENLLTSKVLKKCMGANLKKMSENLTSSISFGATKTMVDFISYKNE
jgi:UDP-N-acetylglucosamine--N-acetylmuramyl-(pentapeptide) pyrophosphoryl-undecaprenol N-acetylglucosamine transferase